LAADVGKSSTDDLVLNDGSEDAPEPRGTPVPGDDVDNHRDKRAGRNAPALGLRPQKIESLSAQEAGVWLLFMSDANNSGSVVRRRQTFSSTAA
jgi:hypothetical protein